MPIKSIVLSVCVICLFSLVGSSQFSVYGKYQPNQIEWQDEWMADMSADVIYDHTAYLGLAYWFRLKNYRVEFHPGAYFGFGNQGITMYSDVQSTYEEVSRISATRQRVYGVEVPIHFYFLDLEGDCNCPTFSKQGNIITKGLYAYINPGFRRTDFEINTWDDGNPPRSVIFVASQSNNFTIAGGFGLDIGLGDLLTITPFTGLEFVPDLKWEGYDFYTESVANTSLKDERNLRSVVLGLRLSVRPDYVKEKRGMFR